MVQVKKNEDPNLLRSLIGLQGDAVTAIVSSLDSNPDEWDFQYVEYNDIVHRKSRIRIDFDNGSATVKDPVSITFGLIGWFRLRRAFKRWKRKVGNTKRDNKIKEGLVFIIKTLN